MNRTAQKKKKGLLDFLPKVLGSCMDCGRQRAGRYIQRIVNGEVKDVWLCRACDNHETSRLKRPPRVTKAQRIKARRAAAEETEHVSS